MKKLEMIRYTVFALIIVVITMILFMTLNQEAFMVEVSANLLGYQTNSFPVLYYVSGAFIIGLVIGCLMAFDTWFSKVKSDINLRMELKDTNTELTALKSELEELKASLPSEDDDSESGDL